MHLSFCEQEEDGVQLNGRWGAVADVKGYHKDARNVVVVVEPIRTNTSTESGLREEKQTAVLANDSY